MPASFGRPGAEQEPRGPRGFYGERQGRAVHALREVRAELHQGRGGWRQMTVRHRDWALCDVRQVVDSFNLQSHKTKHLVGNLRGDGEGERGVLSWEHVRLASGTSANTGTWVP